MIEQEGLDIAANTPDCSHAEEEAAQMQAQVLDERERLRATINSIDDEVWISDAAGNLVMLNPAAQHAHGLTPEGKPVLEVVHALEILNADGKPRLPEDAPVLKALKGETVKGEEIIRHVKTGELRYRRFHSAPILDSQGYITGTVTVSKDITEEKRAEQALREREERHAFLLRLSDTLRPLSDPAEIQATVTHMVMSQYDADRCYYSEIVGSLAIVRQDAARPGLKSAVGEYSLDDYPVQKGWIEAGRPYAVADMRSLIDVDESLRQFCLKMGIISFLDVPVVKEGVSVGILTLTKDRPYVWTPSEIELGVEIAERTWTAVVRAKTEDALRESEARARELVRKLEEGDRNKNRFISVLSHEIRNPLATIVMAQALLKRVPPDSEKARRAMAMQERQTAILTRMVEDLLDVTRISENKIELNLETIDLGAIVQQTVSDVQESFDAKGVALHLNLPLEPIVTQADPFRLAQSVGNLLHNALKFTAPGGTVTVTMAVNADRDSAFIRIADTGKGIEPESLDQIFEPFIQTDQALARTHGGLGLGLSIVKGMVELHGGHVYAESDGIGKGSTFTIRLPIAMH